MASRPRSLIRDRKFVMLILFVASILLIGTVFYSRVEGWKYLDSLYFSTVTLTTVGYGDFSPQTDAGKTFTILYLLFGVGVLLALIAVIADHAIKNYHKITDTYLTRGEKKNNEE